MVVLRFFTLVINLHLITSSESFDLTCPAHAFNWTSNVDLKQINETWRAIGERIHNGSRVLPLIEKITFKLGSKAKDDFNITLVLKTDPDVTFTVKNSSLHLHQNQGGSFKYKNVSMEVLTVIEEVEHRVMFFKFCNKSESSAAIYILNKKTPGPWSSLEAEIRNIRIIVEKDFKLDNETHSRIKSGSPRSSTIITSTLYLQVIFIAIMKAYFQ